MAETRLIGYVRKDRLGDPALQLHISTEEFYNAERHRSGDGSEYITLQVDPGKLREILDGIRDVTSIIQVTGE